MAGGSPRRRHSAGRPRRRGQRRHRKARYRPRRRARAAPSPAPGCRWRSRHRAAGPAETGQSRPSHRRADGSSGRETRRRRRRRRRGRRRRSSRYDRPARPALTSSVADFKGMVLMSDLQHAAFAGRLVIVGFGSIGQGVLPLLLRHIRLRPEQITIITAEERGRDVAAEYGVEFVETALTRANYRDVLAARLGPGDFLLNVSVDVSSVALIELCEAIGALYLDTCIEPWPGGYTDPSLPPSARSNYALREQALAARRNRRDGPTAVITHGANPGLVSHFVKQALIDLAPPGSAVPANARTGRGLPSGSGSRRSTSPSATPRWPACPRRPASSSTPGRSTGSSARARSRPS